MLQFFTKKRGEKGFTLIELLVVIAVIGMLASIVLVSLGPVRKKGRDARRQSDIRQVVAAQEMVMADDEEFFDSGAVSYIPAIKNDDDYEYFSQTYDPTNSGDYMYKWIANTTDKQKFCVYTKSEDTGKWMAASHKGTCFTLTAVPTTLDCWTTCPAP